MSAFAAASEFQDQKFKNLDLPKLVLKGKEFQGCTFISCKFPEVTLEKCTFADCTFKKCDLSLATVPGSRFRNVTFENTKMLGIDWLDAKWLPGFSSITLVECGINYSTFTGLDLRKITLVKCIAREVNFENTNLSEADLQETDFSGSRFAGTNLSKANLIGATNYDIDVTNNNVKQAKFALPEAIALLHSLGITLEGST